MKPETEWRGLRPITQQFAVSFKSLFYLRIQCYQTETNCGRRKGHCLLCCTICRLWYTSHTPAPQKHRQRDLTCTSWQPWINWCQQFLTRHREALQTHWSKPLNTQRAQTLNPTTVSEWFNLVEKHLVLPKEGEGIHKRWLALYEQYQM